MNPHDPLCRYASDLLFLWALCNKPACRRARACKRDARDCLSRYSPLAPEQARCGALAAIEAGRCGISDEQMRMDAGAEIAALEAWRAQVAATADGQARKTVDHMAQPPGG